MTLANIGSIHLPKSNPEIVEHITRIHTNHVALSSPSATTANSLISPQSKSRITSFNDSDSVPFVLPLVRLRPSLFSVDMDDDPRGLPLTEVLEEIETKRSS